MKSPAPRILLIDDEPAVLESLRRILRTKYDITSASNGHEAIERLSEEQPFAVLITDLQMPRMSGSELLRQAKTISPNTVRMALSGVSDLEIALDAVNNGDLFRFLQKPCLPPVLYAAIDDALTQYRLISKDHDFLQRELSRMQAQLSHSERLATLGTLTAGVGHELSNVAAGCIGLLDLMYEKLHDGEVISTDDLDDLVVVARHAQSHANHLLRLGKPGTDDNETTEVVSQVSSILDMLRVLGATSGSRLTTLLPERKLHLQINSTQLEQILVNLVKNASDALRESRTRSPWIQVRVSEFDETKTAAIVVRDNGPGIPADILEKIFEPYFTTKSPDKGTGLGLSVIKQIVEGCGGSTDVHSIPGDGTEFRIQLPLAKAALKAA